MKNVAILGAGRIAVEMAKTICGMKGEAVPYAVASRNIDRAQAFAKEHGFQKAYGSYDEMLADPNVDLVYVAVPHSHHKDCTIQCLRAGKHVLCEKAFAVDEKQAKEMIDLAKEKKLLLTEAIWTRYMPSRKIIDDLIQEGVIGEVKTVSANLDYELTQKERVVEPALAGGALLDIGVYVLNFASMILGDDIKAIHAHCVKYHTGVDAIDSISIEYNSGAMAILYASMLDTSNRLGCINGTKGFIEVDNINNAQEIRVYRQGGNGPETKILVTSIKVPEQITGYEYEVRAAIRAIEEGKLECEEMPHEETLEIMRQMDECRRQFGLEYPL